jgi:hypothetical protein
VSKAKTTLDPRRARKLTSRECSMILGGYLGGMLTSDLIGVAAARDALELWVETEEIWSSIRFQRKRGSGATSDAIDAARDLQGTGADPALRVFWRGLGSVISGLRTVASEKAVKAAVRWIHESEEWWPKEADGK